ncbi:hypothetical protein PYCC9005_000364 [Savitreella phatthalungensis]
MADRSKGRLHCCGAHQHEFTGKPAGLELVLEGSGFEAYGTGDNTESVAVLIATGAAAYKDDHLRMYADVLARGANITVLVPAHHDPEIVSRKRTRDEIKSSLGYQSSLTNGDILTLAKHLKQQMSVDFIGVLALCDNDVEDVERLNDLAANSDARDLLRCLCITTTSRSISMRSPAEGQVPLAVVRLVGDEGDVDGKTLDGREQDASSRFATLQGHAHFYAENTDGKNTELTRNLLFVLKRYLHDWS